VRAWLVANKVIWSSADKRQVAWREFKGSVPFRPEPGAPLDHRMNRELDGSRQPEPQGATATDRANTPPDARALTRCS
jgi:hypothetical protein